MNRRTTLKSLLAISAGAALLPSCLQEKDSSSIALKNIKISAADENVLAGLSNAIIPATDTPGAKEAGAHLFALMMIDDCYPKDDQDKFEKGFKEFIDLAKKQMGTSFLKADEAERSINHIN